MTIANTNNISNKKSNHSSKSSSLKKPHLVRNSNLDGKSSSLNNLNKKSDLRSNTLSLNKPDLGKKYNLNNKSSSPKKPIFSKKSYLSRPQDPS